MQSLRCVSAVLLLACGDPRAPFVGVWSGAFTADVTVGGTHDASTTSTTWSIEATSGSDDLLEWQTAVCSFHARMVGGAFNLLPASCGTQTTDAGCTFAASVESGSGSKATDGIYVSFDGPVTLTCPGTGAQTGSATYQFHGSRN